MRFVSDGIGDSVLEKLEKATDARIAVAFFSPDKAMLSALAGIAKLKLVVSDEFTINNPHSLEKLLNHGAELRSVPTDADEGKLHAKVLIVKLKDGSDWVLLGSANLTYPGMFSNQEACVELDSANPEDEMPIRQIRNWFESLFRRSHQLDIEKAKLLYQNRPKYRPEPRRSDETISDIGYWALKTTSGSTGDSHWQMWGNGENGEISIGWQKLSVDPSRASDGELRSAIMNTYQGYSKGTANHAISTIRHFVGMKIGDKVLICKGYNSTQNKDVHIYGLARVTGSFFADESQEGEWRFKHKAFIQRIDANLSKKEVASALGLGTLRNTLHKLGKASFDRLAEKIEKLGVPQEI